MHMMTVFKTDISLSDDDYESWLNMKFTMQNNNLIQ